MPENFVHLHVHSDMSRLDGCVTVEDYVRTAAERGNPALALTDHGTMRGHYVLTELCDKYGIKPIYGVELYVCRDIGRKGLTEEERKAASETAATKAERKAKIKELEETLRIKKNRHLTVWALDNTGLRNLYQLTTIGWTDGFYYRPRVDLKTILEHSDGLAIGAGCVNSAVYGPWVDGANREAESAMDLLNEGFGDRLYLEIQAHELEDQRQQRANKFAMDVRTIGKHKLLATQDSHYLKQGQHESHDTLIALSQHKNVGEPDRLRFQGSSYWFKTADEIRESFRMYHPDLPDWAVDEAIATTIELAERCTAKIEINPFKCLLPPVEVPSRYKSGYAYLCSLVSEGMKARKLDRRAEELSERNNITYSRAIKIYTDRAKQELRVFKESNFVNYFLILADLYRWVREAEIPRGPGRGSAAGSLVAFLLGITDVDPIEHDLMFERFIAPGRINMPDVDCDFDDIRRPEIIQYFKDKYGEDRVAQISTMSRMNGRRALKDVARAHEVAYMKAHAASSAVPEGVDNAIRIALRESEVLREFKGMHKEVIRDAIALEGLVASIGVHAAGVVTSPVPLVDVLPLETNRSDSEPALVTAYDMRGVEGVGLLKFDILGLKTISVLDSIRQLIIEDSGESFELTDLPIQDRLTLNAFTKRDFIGIFQFDSSSARQVSEGMEYKRFEDIVAINAINRPGAVDFADEFKRRRKSEDAAKKVLFHPKVSQITADALGLMIYQEHVIKVCIQVAGFGAADADKLRKKIGKSEGHEALEENRHQFVSGCYKTTPDMSRDTAEALFDAIVKFGRYGFNKSHAVCYSLLGYWTQYFKQHHPLEFYCAMIRRAKDPNKLHRMVKDAERHGVQTLLPDVNSSGAEFGIDRDNFALRGSLLQIKDVGKVSVAAIERIRKKGKFRDLIDFLSRVPSKAVTVRAVEGLARGGALDSITPNPRIFVRDFRKLWPGVEKKEWLDLKMKFERAGTLRQWTPEERLKAAEEYNPLAMPPHPLITWEPWLDENVKVPLEDASYTLYSSERDVYFAGMIQDYEDRSVGDAVPYEELPDKDVREAIGWDAPWAWITVESLKGFAIRVKIDSSIYPQARQIVDKGRGTLVLICGRTNPEWQSVSAHFIADIEVTAGKLEKLNSSMAFGTELLEEDKLVPFESLFVRHPSTIYPFTTKDYRRLATRNLQSLSERAKGSFRAIGVICHRIERLDKNKRRMGWFGLAGIEDYLDVVCFGSAWPTFHKNIRPGNLALFKLSKLNDGGVHLDVDVGRIHLFNSRRMR